MGGGKGRSKGVGEVVGRRRQEKRARVASRVMGGL